jgi:hypothetical protein
MPLYGKMLTTIGRGWIFLFETMMAVGVSVFYLDRAYRLADNSKILAGVLVFLLYVPHTAITDKPV